MGDPAPRAAPLCCSLRSVADATLVEHVSKRQVLRETGMHWRTLEKILANPEPPVYRDPTSRARPKLGSYLDRIARILEEDQGCPRKQRHTAKRIFDRIATEGYEGNARSCPAAGRLGVAGVLRGTPPTARGGLWLAQSRLRISRQ
jgi:hypothetical protein